MKYDKFIEVRKTCKDVVSPAFEKAGLSDIASKIRTCGDFSLMYDCIDCHSKTWKGFSRCKSKFCPVCNKVKSSIWIARTYQTFSKFLLEGKYIVMFTLTIRDRSSLSDALNILNKAWRYFYKEDRMSARNISHRFIGGVKSLEVKTGSGSGLWHPHLHLLMIKDRYCYDKPVLDALWHRCVTKAGGEFEGVNDIRSIYCERKDGAPVFDKDKLIEAIQEVSKYITKFDYSKEAPERLRELVEGLHNVRQMDTFGVCHNIQKQVEEDLNEDMPLNKIVEHTCKVCGCTQAKLIELLTDGLNDRDDIVIFDEDKYSTMPPKADMIHTAKLLNGVIEEQSAAQEVKTLPVPVQTTLYDDELPY
ncbi:MAG: protein rep [Clostridia bacterium]|nr:protein rep [Clostridia bacterium]